MARPTNPRTLRRLGEFGLVSRIRRSVRGRGFGVAVGIGDDAAVLRPSRGTRLVWTTDMLVEGVHFPRGVDRLDRVGRKAIRVNLSDIAAMGGRPRWALVSVGLPRRLAAGQALALIRGIVSETRANGVALVGGDTNASPRLVVSVALLGEVAGRPVLRSGARIGDLLYVTGDLGGSALGFTAERRGVRSPFIRRHWEPPVRWRLGARLARAFSVRAMIDLSDGLLLDLDQILKASRTGAEVDLAALPTARGLSQAARRLKLDPVRLSLTGGEDYELLFAAPLSVRIPRKIDGVSITRIGMIGPRAWGIRLREGTGRLRPLPKALGFRHF